MLNEAEQKQCPCCKQWFPRTPEHFAPSNKRKSTAADGLRYRCRDCTRLEKKHDRQTPSGRLRARRKEKRRKAKIQAQRQELKDFLETPLGKFGQKEKRRLQQEKNKIRRTRYERAKTRRETQRRRERKLKTQQFKCLEEQVQYSLWQKVGGQLEVLCDAGRIDLLTEEEVIEVKHIRNWKSALGQVLSYAHYFPAHRPRIHLFGEKGSADLSKIKQICTSHDIKVTYSPRTP
jgi:hypothetical protein